jgi:hypothetical protein
MPADEMSETYPIPTRLTLVRVPLRLRATTALSLRQLLEDQVILEEQMAERMRTLIGLVSTSLRRRWQGSASR